MSFHLETERLILQNENESKSGELLDFYVHNKDIFEPFEPTRAANFYTEAYQRACLKIEMEETLKGNTMRFFIYEKENPDKIIGSVVFCNIVHTPFFKATIGYKMDKDYLRKGYAFEACTASITDIFKCYDLNRIEARIASDNTASVKLIEKLGFRFEGIEYECAHVNGRFKDHARYSLLRKDWEKTHSL